MLLTRWWYVRLTGSQVDELTGNFAKFLSLTWQVVYSKLACKLVNLLTL